MMCAIYKWIMSFYITEERQLPTYLERHLNRCGVCRNYYADSIRLTESLRSQAAAGLQIIDTSDASRPSIKRFSLPVWLKTAALVAIVVGGVLVLNHNRDAADHRQKQLECFDSAADMLFNTPSLKYSILTGNAKQTQLAGQYQSLPEIFTDALSILKGNLSTGIEEKQ